MFENSLQFIQKSFPLISLFFLLPNRLKNHVTTDRFLPEYDYIVVGAGSAGCPLSRRLADAGHHVLLLEAGGSESLVSDFPIAAMNLQRTPLDWGYRSEPQKMACFGLKGRRAPWPRGKVLGGCSTLNYMMYIRGESSILSMSLNTIDNRGSQAIRATTTLGRAVAPPGGRGARFSRISCAPKTIGTRVWPEADITVRAVF